MEKNINVKNLEVNEKGDIVRKKKARVKHSKENALRLPDEKTEFFRSIKTLSNNPKLLYKYEIIIHLMVDAGLRVSEALQCRLSWFLDSDKGVAVRIPLKDRDLRNMKKDWIPKSQAGTRTVTFIKKEIGEKVKSYFLTHERGITGNDNKKALSRQRVYQLVKLIGKNMNPAKEIYPHALRSTFANELVQGGVDLHTLCYLMGWDNLETARNYIQTSEAAATKDLLRKFRGEDN